MMLCCECCRSTHCYAPYWCFTVKHTCTTKAPQPPACYPCDMRPPATPNCNPAILHEVPQRSIGATLIHITHNSAQLLKVVHPASAAALQQVGCVNKSDLLADQMHSQILSSLGILTYTAAQSYMMYRETFFFVYQRLSFLFEKPATWHNLHMQQKTKSSIHCITNRDSILQNF